MKEYRIIVFECNNYDEMIHVYQKKYEEKYQLIGYRMNLNENMQYQAELILFERRVDS